MPNDLATMPCHHRVTRVAVEYTKSQDPYLLRTWQYSSSGPQTMIALSPDARTVALATSSTVSVYSVTSDDCVATFQDVFSSMITLTVYRKCFIGTDMIFLLATSVLYS